MFVFQIQLKCLHVNKLKEYDHMAISAYDYDNIAY